MNIQDIFYKKLDYDKIRIANNDNLIKMDLFLSFLEIPLQRSKNHLGIDNGWTKLYNTDYNIEISGGRYMGVEYLDGIKYKEKLHNPYNNYVSPFYIFGILNKDGIDFFVKYYKDDIEKIKKSVENKIESLSHQIDENKKALRLIKDEIIILTK